MSVRLNLGHTGKYAWLANGRGSNYSSSTAKREEGIMTGRSIPGGDLEYFRSRALQEQVAAGQAQGSEATRRHDELAMMYRFKVAMLSSGPDSWVMSLLGGRQPEPA